MRSLHEVRAQPRMKVLGMASAKAQYCSLSVALTVPILESAQADLALCSREFIRRGLSEQYCAKADLTIISREFIRRVIRLEYVCFHESVEMLVSYQSVSARIAHESVKQQLIRQGLG